MPWSLPLPFNWFFFIVGPSCAICPLSHIYIPNLRPYLTLTFGHIFPKFKLNICKNTDLFCPTGQVCYSMFVGDAKSDPWARGCPTAVCPSTLADPTGQVGYMSTVNITRASDGPGVGSVLSWLWRRRRLHGVMRKLPLNSMMAWMGAKNMQDYGWADKGLSGQENEAGHCSCYKVLDNVACLSIWVDHLPEDPDRRQAPPPPWAGQACRAAAPSKLQPHCRNQLPIFGATKQFIERHLSGRLHLCIELNLYRKTYLTILSSSPSNQLASLCHLLESRPHITMQMSS